MDKFRTRLFYQANLQSHVFPSSWICGCNYFSGHSLSRAFAHGPQIPPFYRSHLVVLLLRQFSSISAISPKFLTKMSEEEEQLRMSRLLAADDIAYRRQLEEAVRECFISNLCNKRFVESLCLTVLLSLENHSLIPIF